MIGCPPCLTLGWGKPFPTNKMKKRRPLSKTWVKKGHLLNYIMIYFTFCHGEETLNSKLHWFEWPASRQSRLKSNTNLECAKPGIGFPQQPGRYRSICLLDVVSDDDARPCLLDESEPWKGGRRPDSRRPFCSTACICVCNGGRLIKIRLKE